MTREFQTIYLDYKVTPTPRFGWEKKPHGKLHAIIDRGREMYAERLSTFRTLAEPLSRIAMREDQARSDRPYWRNPWFTGLDALALYGLLSECKPQRYYEIGSGNTTKFAKQAVRDGQLGTYMVSIDPEPRTEIDALCDKVIRQPLEDTDLTLFDELEAGDFLFVDSSHRSFMNSDVTVVFMEVLPRLKPGVYVHFHDIFLPHDYPAAWAKTYYNEQYVLAAALLAEGTTFEIVLPNQFIVQDSELRALLLPVWERLGAPDLDNVGGSFWLRTR
ncbi:class I SAM-dependent methyltransferase [Cohnella faecalis]|uniref:Class I SAM-dependent methyltransferase n=1 Tax=Cohnella faecalis TaxID=2315694 RepID=A0A398CSN5_9BACL|nr:class I SAM-dependent methyltransferase [Cohnella faecalis]RIE02817.1 class I SAM-dependent methyltransferase [Cohnella faecalis]